jgi:1-phosphatidylinositol-4-phosphate 5-kinase
MQVLGNHEPNVILKDNDLKYKLRLPNASSQHLITQLRKDTEFLCSLGVMDYSLLGKFVNFLFYA